MKKSPLISIITPIYNAENTLKKTLDSILSQTYENYEVLMVNDASSDQSREIANSYTEDRRFKLINLTDNSGVANARNVGIDSSSGGFICFLDADDWWESEKLSIQIAQTLEEDLTLSYMSYLRIDEKTAKILSHVRPPKSLGYKDLLQSNHLGNLTTMVKATLIGETRFEKIGHEDYVFWLEILKKGVTAKLINTDKNQCNYLVRADSLSSNKLKAIKWQWNIYRKREKLNFFESVFFLLSYITYALKKRMKA